MNIQLAETIIITDRHKYFPVIDTLCFLSKNLYNSALYEIRQYYFNNKQYLSYNNLNKQFSNDNNIDYRALPYTQMSQQVLKQVDKNFISFFKGIKAIKNAGKHVHIPKYKDKETGRNLIVYTNQCFKYNSKRN